MRIIWILFVLTCLCVGCKGHVLNSKDAQRMNSQLLESGRIASGAIATDRLLPETGALQVKQPKEMKALEPKKLNALEPPKALMPKKSDQPKALVSSTGNF